MAFNQASLVITLDGTGTEIPTLSVNDPYEIYEIAGSVTTTGNYAIVPTGTPVNGTTYVFEYNALTDITTNGNTFSIFGVSLNQTQLLSKLEISCRYNGSAWKVKITGSLDQATITTNSLANNIVTNAKLAQMTSYTLKGNNTGSTANAQDISMSALNNANVWTLTGNSGTTAGTNFIGTTDNVDLVFKANNIESGRINISDHNTSFGKNTLLNNTNGSYNVSIGEDSLKENTTGIGNVAVGTLSLYVNTTGGQNVGIGSNCLSANISGNSNIAVGQDSLSANNIGGGNIGIGSNSLSSNTTGGQNTAIGVSSLQSNTTGSNNTAIGYTADVSSATSTNRISLGYGAIATANYQFALPDDVTTIKWRGITYTLPSADGTAGQVLSTNGSGVLSWITP